jgi:uncharacterized protein YceH (UPF0502 family)
MLVQLTPLQARIIGVLIEKEITTPDQYPLSLNALTLGCNQKSSREPIMQLGENDVQNVIDELRHKNLLLEHQNSGSRVLKYKHRFCNTEFNSLQFTSQQLALICTLLLRGAQTPGELRTRTNRLAQFNNVNEVENSLTILSDFNGEKLVVKLNREPGKRESRFAQLFCDDEGLTDMKVELPSGDARAQNFGTTAETENGFAITDGEPDYLELALARITILEQQVAQFTQQLADMQETLESLSN